jgi:hypothetical protein
MGRAIHMENKLDALESRLKAVEILVEDLEETLDTILDAVPTKKNINLVENTNDKKEKANNERDGSSSKQSNKRAGKSKK